MRGWTHSTGLRPITSNDDSDPDWMDGYRQGRIDRDNTREACEAKFETTFAEINPVDILRQSTGLASRDAMMKNRGISTNQ